MTDRVSSLLFCPTQSAVDNLNREAIGSWGMGAEVVLSGDVIQDGAISYRGLTLKPKGISLLHEFILCTIHRAENTDDKSRLNNIITALNEITKQKCVILPLHPRTKRILEQGDYDISNLKIIDPVGYLNMVWLIQHCDLVMTDSGGLQKKAFFFSKPCLTMRDETEWVELIEHNVNVLVGANKKAITAAFKGHVFSRDFNTDLYGDGSASGTIVRALINYEK